MSNKITKLAVLSLLGILGITACGETASSDPIYAKPGNYDDPVITIDEDGDIHNNILSVIYDSIHDGSLPSDVLEKAMYKFAESVFGVYNEVTANGADVITLKAAYNDAKSNGDNFIVKEFIRKHKAYWNYNDKGVHVDSDNEDTPYEDDENFEPCSAEIANVIGKWDAIENRIAEAMYTKALGGSYTEKNLFDESKFIKSLVEAGEKVDGDTKPTDMKPVFVPYTVEKEDIFKPFTVKDPDGEYSMHILHRELYQTSIDSTKEIIVAEYIEDEVIPTIYSDLLIEQYLLEEDVQAIRNSKARKINVIKIEKYANFTNNAQKLVNHLIDEIYTTNVPTTKIETNQQTIEDRYTDMFKKYAAISKGLYDEIAATEGAMDIITALQATSSDTYEANADYEYDGYTYKSFKNTTYGDLVDEFKKLTTAIKDKNYDDFDKSMYDSYTSNGSTTVTEGMIQKTLAITQTESITKGWFTSSKTPSLDSNGTINKNLFTLSVADKKIEVKADATEGDEQYDKLAATDRFVKKDGVFALRKDENGNYKWSEDEHKYLCSINGAYFLKFRDQYAGDDPRKDIVYDDGNAYYIVQVLEAVKDSKLRNATDSPKSSYAVTRGADVLHDAIDNISKILGETGNYATVSKNHWLKKMNITYHDQVVYDYFKANYPDLFD